MKTNVILFCLCLPFYGLTQVTKNALPTWKYNKDRSAYAVIDSKGKEISDYIYQYPTAFRQGTATAWTDGSYFFIKQNGKTDSVRYQYIHPLTNDIYWVLDKNKKPMYLNADGQPTRVNYPMFKAGGHRFSYLIGDKTGIIDSLGSFITPAVYEKVLYVPNFNRFILKKDSLYGQCDFTGKTIIPFEFTFMEEQHNVKLFLVQKAGNWGMLRPDGSFAIPCKYESLTELNKNFVKFKNGGKWGVLHKDNMPLIEPIYDKIDIGQPTHFIVSQNGFTSIIDSTGKLLLPFKFTSARMVFNNILVGNGSKYGLWDKDGNTLLETIYDDISPKSKEHYEVVKNRLHGVFHEKLGMIIPTQYPHCLMIKGNYFVLSDKPNYGGELTFDYNKWKNFGLADDTGKFIFKIEEQNQQFMAFDPQTKIFFIRRNTKSGLYDAFGNEIYPPIFDDVQSLGSSNYFGVKKDGKYALFNTKKELLTKYEYESIYTLKKDLMIVSKNELVGWIDTLGKTVLPPKYYRGFKPFNDSIWIAQQATAVVQAETDNITGFADTQTKNKDNQKWYGGEFVLISENGKVLLDEHLSAIEQPNKGFAKIKRGKKCGYLDANGMVALPPDFVDCRINNNKFITATDGGLNSIWKDGKMVIPHIYNGIGTVMSGWVWTTKKDSMQYFTTDYQTHLITADKAQKIYTSLSPSLFQRYEYWDDAPDTKGWIRVSRDGKWGWIDRQGNEVISCRFDATTPFIKGLARVAVKNIGHDIFLNSSGEYIMGQYQF